MTRFPRALSCLAGAVLLAVPAAAQRPDGNEFRINFTTTGNQNGASVGMAPNGDFLIAWRDGCTDCWESALYVGPSGMPWSLTGQGAPNQTMIGPSIAGVPPDGFVIAWAENPLNLVRTLRYNSGILVEMTSTRTNAKNAVDVAADASANYVVVWESAGQDGDGTGIYARRGLANSGGTREGAEFRVNTTTTGDQKAPAVASAADGRYVVVWQTGPTGSACCARVSGQRYAADGTPAGGEFLVSTNSAVGDYFPDVAADAAGNFVVTWTAYDQYSGYNFNVLAQRYSSAGAPQGGIFRVNAATSGIAGRVRVSVRSSEFFVVWDEKDSDGSSYGVYGRRYASNGGSLTAPFRINTYTAGSQYFPSIAGTTRYVVAWQSVGQDGSGAGVYAQKFCLPGDANGDGAFNVIDVFYLINAVFAGGTKPTGCGDANGDSKADVADVFVMINALFAGGPAPI